jgi:hypothetical protein
VKVLPLFIWLYAVKYTLPDILGKGEVLKIMNKNFFNASVRLTRRPDYDSPLPEFMDISQNSSGQELTLEYALQDILELNENPEEHRLQETYSLDLRNDSRNYFQLKDYNNNTRMAS